MQDCCFFSCAICSFLTLSFCCQNCSQTPMEWNSRQYTVFFLAKWALFDSLIVKKASSSRLSWKEINWKIKYKVLSDSRFKSVCVFIERGFFDNIRMICKKMRLFSVCICTVALVSLGCADFSVLWLQALLFQFC